MAFPFGIGWLLFWVMPFPVFFRLIRDATEKTPKTQISSDYPLAHLMPHFYFSNFRK